MNPRDFINLPGILSPCDIMSKLETQTKESHQYKFKSENGLGTATERCTPIKEMSSWEKGMLSAHNPTMVEKLISKGILRRPCEGFE
jgi:hypothetical protein